MSVTSNPTPGDELIPDTSGLPDLSGVDTPASSPGVGLLVTLMGSA